MSIFQYNVNNFSKVRRQTHPEYFLPCAVIRTPHKERRARAGGAQVVSLDGEHESACKHDVGTRAPATKPPRTTEEMRITVYRVMEIRCARLMIVGDPRAVVARSLHIGRWTQAQRRHTAAPVVIITVEIGAPAIVSLS